MRNPYFILLISICLLYYFLFKYKGDREWKRNFLIATIGGFIVSIATILEEIFVSSQSIIRNIAIVPVCIVLISYIYFAYSKLWKMRKNQENKTIVYLALGWGVFTVMLIITILILAFFTDFFG